MSEMDDTEIREFERFPVKLWKMLKSAQNGAIQWGTTGKTFLIEIESFQEEYLDNTRPIFRTQNLQSFIRQLNLYGFRNVKIKERDPMRNPRDKNLQEYYHESFNRYNRDLALTLKRQIQMSKRKKIPKKNEAASTTTAARCQKLREHAAAKPKKGRMGKRANPRKVLRRLKDNGEFRMRKVKSKLPQVDKSRSNLARILYERYEEFAHLHEIPIASILVPDEVVPTPAGTCTPVASGTLAAEGTAVGVLGSKEQGIKDTTDLLHRIDCSLTCPPPTPDAAAPPPDAVHIGRLVAAYLVLDQSRPAADLLAGGGGPGPSRQCVLLLIDQSDVPTGGPSGDRTLGWAVLRLEGAVALDAALQFDTAGISESLAGIDVSDSFHLSNGFTMPDITKAIAGFDVPDGFGATVATVEDSDDFLTHDVTEAIAGFDVPDGFGSTAAAVEDSDDFLTHDVTQAIAGFDVADGFEVSVAGIDGPNDSAMRDVSEAIAGFDVEDGFVVLASAVVGSDGLLMHDVTESIAALNVLDEYKVTAAVFLGSANRQEPDEAVAGFDVHDEFYAMSELDMEADDAPAAAVDASPAWGLDMETSMSGLYAYSPQSGASNNSKMDVRGMSLVPVGDYEEEIWGGHVGSHYGMPAIQNNDPEFASLFTSFNPSSEDSEPDFEDWYGSPFEGGESSTNQYWDL